MEARLILKLQMSPERRFSEKPQVAGSFAAFHSQRIIAQCDPRHIICRVAVHELHKRVQVTRINDRL
jgi:hypothetical protein